MDSVPAEPSKWTFDLFSAVRTSDGKILARGAQYDNYEEIGELDGVSQFVSSKEFEELNIGFILDEWQASTANEFRVFYSD
ncbi:hypothetical protein MLD38_022450 [Melastoma candidum]|uniref:Uncharacterized protein n=1 Tax=Melastoma candidum TaxID=119954 RepID=A0ACB9QN71_9MYRT|nr:hypothetical protein MLD38_022450 [Melastoma candidum]